MDIPDPTPGLVIRYAYLWRDEAQRGLEEGRKDRPCAVVLAVDRGDDGIRVVVAPITHYPPDAAARPIAIPPATAARLGLDDLPQWIITRELNLFTWPGPDIRPVPNVYPATIAHGHLPHGLARQLIDAVRQHVRDKTAAQVERDT